MERYLVYCGSPIPSRGCDETVFTLTLAEALDALRDTRCATCGHGMSMEKEEMAA
jgi:hypothetical protein